jgi:hypothetical protein
MSRAILGCMTTSVHTPSRATAPNGAGIAAAVIAGLAAIGLATFHLVTPGGPQATFGSLADWLRDLGFLAYLLGSVVAVVSAGSEQLAPTATVRLVGAGYGLIGLGVIAGLLLQDDPDWFFLLGGPGLLLSAAGFITWAIVSGRRGTLPAWAAVWVGIGGLVAIIGAEAGTSLVIGLFWLWYVARIAGRTRRSS